MALVHRGRIVGFFLVGVISSLVDLGLLYCCTEYLGIWYLASAAASYCCGMLVNYGLNKHLNFRDGTGYTVRQSPCLHWYR
jgi:putative flippase GtrA